MTMLTEETERVVLDDGGDWDDDLVHISCECSEDLALCGGDLLGEEVPYADDELCVVCIDLEKKPCPRCGGVIVR